MDMISKTAKKWIHYSLYIVSKKQELSKCRDKLPGRITVNSEDRITPRMPVVTKGGSF